MNYEVSGKFIRADDEGFLISREEWSPEVMHVIASSMGLELTENHLTVINAVRRYYQEYATTPAMRSLIALLKKEGRNDLADSITLAVLFPDGAAKSAAKLAGLPKPVKCI